MAGVADYLKLAQQGYGITPPDVGKVFSDAGRGATLAIEGKNQQTLADVGLKASQGDMQGAQNAAFAGGNVDMGLKLDTHQRTKITEAMKQLNELGATAESQNDAQWAQTVQMYRDKGMNVPAQFEGPQGRTLAIAQTKSTMDKLKEELAKSQRTHLDAETAFTQGPKAALTNAQAAQANAHASLFQATADDKTGGMYAPYKDAAEKARVEAELRKEATAAGKDYNSIRDAHANIQALSKQPSAEADIALIFSFMKVLDPTSVVREGEFATAQNAAGVPDRIVNTYNRMLRGERLNDDQRGDFVKQSGTIEQQQRVQHERRMGQFRGVAERNKMDWRNIVPDAFSTPSAQQAQPQTAPPTAPPPQGGAAAPQSGRPRAVNPSTGQAIEWNGSAWVPAQ